MSKTRLGRLSRRADKLLPEARSVIVCWCVDPDHHDPECPALTVGPDEVVYAVEWPGDDGKEAWRLERVTK